VAKKGVPILMAAIMALAVVSSVGIATATVDTRDIVHSISPALSPNARVWNVIGPDGRICGKIGIDTKTDRYALYGFDHGIQPRTKYYLQYHVNGLAGAKVITSVVASQQGSVSATGKLDDTTLALLNKPGQFMLLPHVL